MTSLLPNLRDGFSYQHHLVYCEPVTSSKVAGSTCGLNITFYVRLGVINSIKAAIEMIRAAVHTWFSDKIKDFFCSKITLINSGVGVSQKNSPTFFTSVVSTLPFTNFLLLFRAKVLPPIRSIIPATLTSPMAITTLVSNAQWPRGVFDKDFRCSWKRLFAAVTSSGMYILHEIPKRVVGQ